LPKPTCFLKKARPKIFIKTAFYAVLDGSRWQWQRSAICPQDSFAKQSADRKPLWVFEGKTSMVLIVCIEGSPQGFRSLFFQKKRG
jgi:hypothetical protein